MSMNILIILLLKVNINTHDLSCMYRYLGAHNLFSLVVSTLMLILPT